MPRQCRVYIRRLFLTIHAWEHTCIPSIHTTQGYAEIPSLCRFLCAASGKSLASVSSSVSLSFTRSIASYSFGVDGECLLHERPLIMPPLSRQLIIRPRLPEYLSYSSQKFQPISISTPHFPFSRAHPSEHVSPALSPAYVYHHHPRWREGDTSYLVSDQPTNVSNDSVGSRSCRHLVSSI